MTLDCDRGDSSGSVAFIAFIAFIGNGSAAFIAFMALGAIPLNLDVDVRISVIRKALCSAALEP